MRTRSIREPQMVLPARDITQRSVLARRMLGAAMKFGAGSGICGEGEPVEYVYEVAGGAVRTVKEPRSRCGGRDRRSRSGLSFKSGGLTGGTGHG
jgi:hypothetical protein